MLLSERTAGMVIFAEPNIIILNMLAKETMCAGPPEEILNLSHNRKYMILEQGKLLC
jgi:hypothetical protein